MHLGCLSANIEGNRTEHAGKDQERGSGLGDRSMIEIDRFVPGFGASVVPDEVTHAVQKKKVPSAGAEQDWIGGVVEEAGNYGVGSIKRSECTASIVTDTFLDGEARRCCGRAGSAIVTDDRGCGERSNRILSIEEREIRTASGNKEYNVS